MALRMSHIPNLDRWRMAIFILRDLLNKSGMSADEISEVHFKVDNANMARFVVVQVEEVSDQQTRTETID